MKMKILTSYLSVLVLMSMSSNQVYGEKNSDHFYAREDSNDVREKKAEALIENAIAFYDANGKEEALLEFRKPDGKFCTQYQYDPSGLIVSEEGGVFLSYCKHPCQVGKQSHELTTPDDKTHFKEMSSMMENGKGEIVKKKGVTTMNPFTGLVSEAVLLAKKHDGLLFMNVIYDDKPLMDMEPVRLCDSEKENK